MKSLEIHVIQNFSPNCLNRDDTNAPKDCVFGGFRRARGGFRETYEIRRRGP